MMGWDGTERMGRMGFMVETTMNYVVMSAVVM
jgi:hypothetical protein